MADAETITDAPPEWDLRDLYASPDSPDVENALTEAERTSRAFAERWAGKLDAASGASLADAVIEYEQLQELFGRLMSYAQLLHAGNLDDPEIGRFQQTVQERVTTASAHTVFFALELNRIEDAALERKFGESEALARYRPWFRDLREYRPYQLSDEIERLLHEKHVVGRSAWVRLFDETMARLRFPVRGEKLTSSEALNLLTDRDRSLRKEAATAIAG
ncbi:MAG: oligoendopeptidase F, partial [Pseudomonadota bacterium]